MTPEQMNQNQVVWLKPEQVEAMRDACYDGRYGTRDEAIVTLLYDTGLRRVELRRLNRDMLSLDDSELRIPAGIQKEYGNDNSPDPVTFALDPTGDLRTVRTLRSYLDSRDDDKRAVFTSNRSDRMTVKGIYDVVKRSARRADVEPYTYEGRGTYDGVSPHTLRHSVAYRMLRAEDGNTLYDVRNRLRHSSIKTTERNYDHFDTV